MGPKKTLERIKYSFFWEGLRADVKKFCESCKECQLTRSVRIKDRSSSIPVARPELPFEVLRMLEQFVVSRIVDIDILMQIWKNRVKQINFVLEWVGRVRNYCLHLATGRTRDGDREEDLATTEGKKSERERRGVTRKTGLEKPEDLTRKDEMDWLTKNSDAIAYIKLSLADEQALQFAVEDNAKVL
ncbi:retrovirus-related Pol polyprotein from transposon opus [Trichonephila clavipes]|nr:retrovirus-related Pol polyprotein from transposon opus [Trichonephila clavipes]